MNLSVIVPVFNSEDCVPLLVERLRAVLTQRGWRGELILVDDGSHDGSWGVIQQLASGCDWISGINLMRNYGQHNALLCGIRAAKNEIIVTMDDDLQNPPEEIPNLLQKLSEGYDVVYGVPRIQQHGLLRDLASYITKMVLQNAMGASVAGSVSAFRAFRRDLRSVFQDFRGPYVNVDVLLTWATTNFAALEVDHQSRPHGESNYTWRKLVTHALNMMTGFSTLPLKLASIVGFASTVFGLVLLLYVFGRYIIEGGSPPGFPFLASAIAIFSGAQLFALGIFGEYLARMHFRVMDRPAYAVRATTAEQVRG